MHITTVHRSTIAIVASVGLAIGATACGSDGTIDDVAEGDTEAVATDLAGAVDTVVEEAEAQTDDLAQALRDNGLDNAAGIVEEIDVSELIAGEEFTFFAPTDEAFTSLSADETADLLGDPTMVLDVLRNHTLNEAVTAAELTEAGSVQTEAGETVEVTEESGEVEIGGVVVVTTDITVGDGVIHVVDGFLLP
jgi:uncharacterized surface protein with fasciclin (FAS1) repeats